MYKALFLTKQYEKKGNTCKHPYTRFLYVNQSGRLKKYF